MQDSNLKLIEEIAQGNDTSFEEKFNKHPSKWMKELMLLWLLDVPFQPCFLKLLDRLLALTLEKRITYLTGIYTPKIEAFSMNDAKSDPNQVIS